MADSWWILGAGVLAVVLAAVFVWWPLRCALRDARLAEARKEFHRQREWLEVRFIQIASAKAKPGAPSWSDCEFDNDVAYVRNRYTGELSAFVGIAITFDDLLPPADAAADGYASVRTGTAVFRFTGEHWDTEGRAILNLSPVEAVRFYQDDLEMIAQEVMG